jgi:peptide/nickel transport system substrate-binding protein
MTRFGTKAIGGLALAVASVTALAACSSSSSSTPSASASPVSGGTATWAEPPSATPNYIFPFTSSSYDTVTNTNEFQFLLYRPLYWFGVGNQPTVNTTKSLANYPTFSSDGKTVTITLKSFKWSNGQPVTAQNVMFWLNMESAIGATNYGAYTGFPNTLVSSTKVVSPTELTLTLNKAVNQTWFVYNDLSQVTPMPEAWDVTASGPSHCSTTVSDCAKVYSYLDGQSRNMTGYVSSPLWKIVDGPWKLSAFNADGHITMVPNTSYSGSDKPHLTQFQELPFTTEGAEWDVLRSASSSSKIDVGYVPTVDLPAKPANEAVGSNPLSGYTLSPWYTWGLNYFPLNLQSTVSDHAAIFKQTYFRQALEYLMNQEAVLAGPLKGYGTLTVGPVGSQPVTSWLSPQLHANPFPYSPTMAKSLLTSHGWTVNAGGTTTCSNPSLCGPGISSGSALNFNLPYATGTAWIEAELTQLQSNAAALGIKLNLEPKPFNQVVALAAGNCVVAKIPCNWDMADWGGGWSFYPDVSPTGETLFKCGAIANSGGYCSTTNDALIDTTLTNSSLSAMYTWQNYLSSQVPMLWQPNGAYAVTEVVNNLKGVIPQEPTLNIVPEDWYYVS